MLNPTVSTLWERGWSLFFSQDMGWSGWARFLGWVLVRLDGPRMGHLMINLAVLGERLAILTMD